MTLYKHILLSIPRMVILSEFSNKFPTRLISRTLINHPKEVSVFAFCFKGSLVMKSVRTRLKLLNAITLLIKQTRDKTDSGKKPLQQFLKSLKNHFIFRSFKLTWISQVRRCFCNMWYRNQNIIFKCTCYLHDCTEIQSPHHRKG